MLDKEKANFCDFFKVNSKAYSKKDDAAAIAAKASLAELFGEEVEEDELESATPTTEADKALDELKRLFGDDSE